jgi:hypothetical protein
MNLQSWTSTRVRKQKAFLAKNYLNNDEFDTLRRGAETLIADAEDIAQLEELEKNLESQENSSP